MSNGEFKSTPSSLVMRAVGLLNVLFLFAQRAFDSSCNSGLRRILCASVLLLAASYPVVAQTPQTAPLLPQASDVVTSTAAEALPVTVEPGRQTPAPAAQKLQHYLPFLITQTRTVRPASSLIRLGVTSGDTLPLTLNEAVRRALENNNEIEIARTDVLIAEGLLRSFQGVYDPIFQITPRLSNFVSPGSSSLAGTDQSGTVTTTSLDLTSSVTKNFERGGGRYEFFFDNTRQTTTSTFDQLSPNYATNLGVTFTQPLLRDRSIDNNRRLIRIQRKRLEQSDADFRRRTIEVIAQVQRAYWDLVFALRNQQNQLANLNLARENFRNTELSVAAGATAPLERAEVQIVVSNRESDLLLASQIVSVAENNLKQLLLRDPEAKEWSAQLLPTEQLSLEETPVDLNSALEQARSNRPELRRMQIEESISDIDLQYFRNQLRPRIDIQATIATTGLAGAPVVATGQLPGDASTVPANLVGGYGRSLRNLFSLNTRSIVVGVTIQFPLRNKTAKANLGNALVQRTRLDASTRSQEQTVEVEVRNAAQAVETARQNLISVRTARENAELQLAGERGLYQVGRSTTFLLLQRDNELAGARNQQLRAEIDYTKALVELQRATSTTLSANNVIVETPGSQ